MMGWLGDTSVTISPGHYDDDVMGWLGDTSVTIYHLDMMMM